jgi:hypothetical protein
MSQESTESATQSADQAITNPIGKNLSAEQKADLLCEMSRKNKPIIDNFIKQIDEKFGCRSTSNCKPKEKILAKASRPLLRDEKPWFDVEHIRDGLRFRTALNDFSDLPDIIEALRELNVIMVKAETAKMLNPRIWGWRAVMYDIRLPDGQLVEYYLTVKEMMDANDNHHALYEEWREKTTEYIDANAAEYEQALDISNDAFDKAWSAYLERTGQDESTISDVIDSI